MKRTLLGFLVLATLVSNANAQAPETFVPTGNLTTPRQEHTATLLKDGRVLIAGGYNGEIPDYLQSAELYDPSTGTFSLTGSMTTGRASHTTTVLTDGRVLIAGGFLRNQGTASTALRSAELYDPVTGTFTPTGDMVVAQWDHTATLLKNGKVLITAGVTIANGSPMIVDADAELYDPSTGSFSPVDLAGSTQYSKAAPLFDGKVLISGGRSAAKLYDPATNAVESFPARLPFLLGHTETLLPTGKVLIAGGVDLAADYFDPPLEQAEVYDSASRTFQATQSLLFGRAQHTATLLPGGLLLIAGGWTKGDWDPASETFNLKPALTAELFDPYAQTFRLTGSMASFHWSTIATLVGNGTVLFTGGNTTAAELYLPPLLTFGGGRVRPGDSFTATFSGTSLNNETYYDLRFIAPGETTDVVTLNWQQGRAATHTVATGMVAGTWTVTGVRPHQIETDHTGSFIPVSASITVSP